MDKNQEILVKLLSAAIRGREMDELDCEGVNWRSVYEEAKAHEVYTLIYPIINSHPLKNKIEKRLMAEWNNIVLYSGMYQVQHIQQMVEVLSQFNKSGIPVIALKGLIVRTLYPQPDLRTMSDADILVKRDDIEKSKNLLIKLGYHIHSQDSKHIHFSHESHPPIELHQSLVDYNRFKGVAPLENNFWANAVSTYINDTPVFSLSLEDQILHLCLHMASHFRSNGFGLRQLCDLILIVESNNDLINWDTFIEKSKICGIYNFSLAIFVMCNILFEMDVPRLLYDKNLENEPFIKRLISDIFAGGVYGAKDNDRVISGLQIHFSQHSDSQSTWGRIRNTISLMLPTAGKLGQRYSYARKHVFLTPVAWIHRGIWCILRKDLDSSQKRNFIISSDKTKSITQERTKLLRWLQLR